MDLDDADFALDDADLRALDALEVGPAPPQQSLRLAPPAPAQSSSALPQPTVGANAAAPRQPVPRRLGPSGGLSVIVSPRQEKNPLLQNIRGVSWEFGDIAADYVVEPSTAVLFLSLKYHRIHPEYIFNRITKLPRNFRVRVLLVVIDIDNHEESLKLLTKTGVINNLTILLAWSIREAANYVSLLARLKSIPPTAIQAPQKDDYATQIQECFTAIRGINKTDAANLISNFGSLHNAVADGGRSLSALPGFGDRKVHRFRAAITDPFIVRNDASAAYMRKLKEQSRTKMPIVQPRQATDGSDAAADDDDTAAEDISATAAPARSPSPQSSTKAPRNAPVNAPVQRRTFANAMSELQRMRSEM
ncbi:restriction endonuclease type II-like protein [Limtongia smithiae]|uniref:restriction endonuclease type II-like protein n=1 Tax=Limtongia smithiae TaxID=1125753 RepID=UPI0034CF2996